MYAIHWLFSQWPVGRFAKMGEESWREVSDTSRQVRPLSAHANHRATTLSSQLWSATQYDAELCVMAHQVPPTVSSACCPVESSTMREFAGESSNESVHYSSPSTAQAACPSPASESFRSSLSPVQAYIRRSEYPKEFDTLPDAFARSPELASISNSPEAATSETHVL